MNYCWFTHTYLSAKVRTTILLPVKCSKKYASGVSLLHTPYRLHYIVANRKDEKKTRSNTLNTLNITCIGVIGFQIQTSMQINSHLVLHCIGAHLSNPGEILYVLCLTSRKCFALKYKNIRSI